jgi:cell division septal protein FtsQ
MDAGRRDREMQRRREEQLRLAKQRRIREKKQKQKKRKNWFKNGHGFVFMLCILGIGAFLVASFTVLFPVKHVVVEGNLRYTVEEITIAASIGEEANLLRLSPKQVEENIRRQCPYVADVTLKRKLPSKAVIVVTELPPALAFPVGKQFVLTTAECEYIETTDALQNATEVYGVGVTPGLAGQRVTFTDSKQEEAFMLLMKELQTLNITEISKIDLTDQGKVRLQYKNQHIWILGDLTNLNYKLQFAYQVSQKETNTGTLDLSALTGDNKNSYFRSGVLGEFVETVTDTDVVVSEENNPNDVSQVSEETSQENQGE